METCFSGNSDMMRATISDPACGSRTKALFQRALEIIAQSALQTATIQAPKDNPIVTNYVLGILDRTAECGVKGNAVFRREARYFHRSMKASICSLSLIVAFLWTAGLPANAQVNVTQEHNHLSRDGLYVDPAFAPSNAANLTRDLNFNGTISGNV